MPRLAPAARRGAALALATLAAAGCQDLTVDNVNNPDVTGAFRDPLTLETIVATSFRAYWGVSMGARDNASHPVYGLAALADEITSPDSYPLELLAEPRPEYNNRDAGQWFNRKTWYDLYEVIATNTDAIVALDEGVKIGPVTAAAPEGANSARTRYLAKFMQGLAHAQLGVLFDQGFVLDETMRDQLRTLKEEDRFTFEMQPSSAVFAAGMAQLQEAVRQMHAAPVQTMPPAFLNGVADLDNRELARVAQSYMARFLVANARTPAERAAVDWRLVLQKLDSGITTRAFGQQASVSVTGTTSAYVQQTQLQTNARINYRLIGPADTSGAYQRWLTTPVATRAAIDVVTPDRRIHAAGGPRTRGLYYERLATQTMPTGQGSYLLSNYRGVRYGTNFFQTGFINTLTPAEMRFLRAEALIRLGRAAEAAALINVSRTASTGANLPAVTAAGPPAGRACVPRRDNGSCGNLMDALMYEKRIELQGQTDPMVSFTDWRGWGRLLRGSLVQMPVPGRELQTLGMPVYSFGGALPGSAPDPTGPGI